MVSVVLPTRNRANLLAKAVKSVLTQTWSSLEVVVVDDGSSDRTEAVLGKLGRRDDRLRVIRFSESRGAACARNRGIAEARGEYVAFQDDDCIWIPKKLELLVSALEDAGPGVGFAYSAVESEELDGSLRILGMGHLDEKYRGPWLMGTCAVMVSRESLVRTGGFDERLPRLQDFDLWVRILVGTNYAFVPRVLVRTLRVVGGISTHPDALRQAAVQLRTKYHEYSLLTAAEEAHVCHALGHKLMREGYWLEAVRSFLDAVRTNPRLGRSWLALGASALGVRGYRAAARWRARQLAARATVGAVDRKADHGKCMGFETKLPSEGEL